MGHEVPISARLRQYKDSIARLDARINKLREMKQYWQQYGGQGFYSKYVPQDQTLQDWWTDWQIEIPGYQASPYTAIELFDKQISAFEGQKHQFLKQINRIEGEIKAAQEAERRRTEPLRNLDKTHQEALDTLKQIRQQTAMSIEDVYSDMKQAIIKQMLAYQGIRNMKKRGIGADTELKLNLNIAQRIAAAKASLQKRYELAKRMEQENYLQTRFNVEKAIAGGKVSSNIAYADYLGKKNILPEILTALGSDAGGVSGTLLGKYAAGLNNGSVQIKDRISGDIISTANKIEQMFNTLPKSYYNYYNSSDMFNRPLYNPQTGGIKAQSIGYGTFTGIAET